ncbi:hypothetical protein [Fodinicurvata fenggangensis]|uniref:hypothetical protein n=1 Tax=Fodinicurvata fenggangensis TaxID=1121830 RepID=UPI0012DEC1FC|nr:hypothetical protein [Fodinicurvata fenggangensis]
MMAETELDERLLVPQSLEEALLLLSVPYAAPLAGATWLMRAPLRGEARRRAMWRWAG